MDIQSIGAIIFVLLASIFLIIKRKKIILQNWPKTKIPIFYTALYRTKLGIKLMDWLANLSPRFWRVLGTIGIVIGFIGMSFTAGYLVYAFVKAILALFAPNIPSTVVEGVALVLPFKIKGTFYVPFFYWLTTLFVVIVVHEFAHGIMARVYGIKVKASGFAVMGIIAPLIPAAFVEPEEKELIKRSHKQQMAVFAAGPFANILLAIFVLLVLMPLSNPLTSTVADYNGVKVENLLDDAYGLNPAKQIGVVEGDRIVALDGIAVNTIQDFTNIIINKKPHEPLIVTKISKTGEVTTQLTELGHLNIDPAKAYFGITASQSIDIKPEAKAKYGILVYPVKWLGTFLYWLYALSLGIGLFNLLPLGPIDGGRMMKSVMHKIFKTRSHAETAWMFVSVMFFFVIIGGLILGFVR